MDKWIRIILHCINLVAHHSFASCNPLMDDIQPIHSACDIVSSGLNTLMISRAATRHWIQTRKLYFYHCSYALSDGTDVQLFQARMYIFGSIKLYSIIWSLLPLVKQFLSWMYSSMLLLWCFFILQQAPSCISFWRQQALSLSSRHSSSRINPLIWTKTANIRLCMDLFAAR